jgi:DMSO/TMAO reductase YedYZ heme-binding membrane subunit
MSPKTNTGRGAIFIALISTLIFATVLLTVSLIADPEQAWRSAIRLTARTSAVLFLMAFSASAVATLWPGRFTSWLVDYRRYLGLSFAASHAIHAYAIWNLTKVSDALSHQILQYDKIIPQEIAYLFIFALAATSSNKAQKMLGMRWWNRLHLIGTHYLWLVFLIAFLKHTSDHPEDWVGVILVFAAMVIRIAARRQHRAAQGSGNVGA